MREISKDKDKPNINQNTSVAFGKTLKTKPPSLLMRIYFSGEPTKT
jgi:hypothetical protein